MPSCFVLIWVPPEADPAIKIIVEIIDLGSGPRMQGSETGKGMNPIMDMTSSKFSLLVTAAESWGILGDSKK